MREAMIPGNKRIKTDIRVPVDFQEGVDSVCEKLGVPKNAFYSMSAGFMLAELIPILAGNPKRKIMLQKIRTILNDAIDCAIKYS